MVPPAGIEPALQWNAILNRTRLPVPPWRQLLIYDIKKGLSIKIDLIKFLNKEKIT